MSELDKVLAYELASWQPSTVPPFAMVAMRRRDRHLRRVASTSVLAVVIGAFGVGVVSGIGGAADTLSEQDLAGSSATPTATLSQPSPGRQSPASCVPGGLSAADARRLAIYTVALDYKIGRRVDGDTAPEPVQPQYLTRRPIVPRSGPRVPLQQPFSPGLRACLLEVPAAQSFVAVDGILDPAIPGPRGGLSDIAGEVFELSVITERPDASVEVLVSRNGGGGFDYSDVTLRIEKDAAGGWRVTKMLSFSIA